MGTAKAVPGRRLRIASVTITAHGYGPSPISAPQHRPGISSCLPTAQ